MLLLQIILLLFIVLLISQAFTAEQEKDEDEDYEEDYEKDVGAGIFGHRLTVSPDHRITPARYDCAVSSTESHAHPTPNDATDVLPPSTGSADFELAPLGETTGTLIGPYRILQLIGEGGFGSVFLAEQKKPVQRKVALKIIKLGMDTRQVIARFEQERQALALMDHPNIAKVLDAGATDTGRPFFVMEFCTGDSITHYCDDHNLSVPERLDLLVQVCQAVQHAHQKGLIHRDIKPSNILVATEDGKPHARVIDFGIAKATGGSLTEKTLVTQHLQVVGTPHYMSPEQAAGSLDIDTRTDVYSLGVLLYELLTGTMPFDSRGLRLAGDADLPRIIRDVEAPQPSARVRSMMSSQASSGRATPGAVTVGSGSARSPRTVAGWSVDKIAAHRRTEPRRLSASIRGDLDWIVMKAMEKDRTRRYETATGLASDIKRHLGNEPVVAGPPGTTYRLRKFIKRNRVMVSAGSLVAAALVLGIIGTTIQSVRATRAADKAERAAYQAQMVSAAHAVEDQRMDAAGALLSATAPRLRGWEYQHLESRLDRTLPSPFPADWLITGCTTSPDSRVIAVQRSAGGGPKEWVVLDRDLRTPRLVVPDTDMYSFRFSSDGRRALWVPPMPHHAGPAILWDVESARVLATFPIDHDPRPDWSLMVTWTASGDDGGDRVMVSHPDGYQIHDGHTGARLHIATSDGYMYFTEDERWMVLVANRQAVATNAGQLRLVDSHTFEPSADFYRFDSPVNQISFRESSIICALEDGTLRLLDIVEGVPRERTKIVAGISNFNHSAVWSPDGRMIAIGSLVSGRVRAWDAESGALVGDFGGPQSGVASQWFLPDSSGLWACDAIGHHHVWPMSSGSPGVLTAHKSYVYPAVFSRDGSMLVTGGWDGLIGHAGGLKFWDARTGALVAEYGQPGEIFRSADLTRDGRYVVAGMATPDEANHRTEVLDLTTGAVVTTFKSPSLYPVCTILHPDGHRVISAYGRGDAYVWDLMTGKVAWQTDLLSEFSMRVPSTAAAVSPDGRTLAFADRRLGIRLVNADTYADIRRWDAHTDGIWSLSFSPDGRWLLSASEDQTVGVWDVATGSLVTRLTGHGAQVLCAAMSPDGTRIASGGRDGIVRFWDTTHFENVAQLAGHGDYIYRLTWNPDGHQLISTSGDSTVRIWDIRTFAEQMAAARDRTDSLPDLEARIARARHAAALAGSDVSTAVEQAIAAPDFTPRQREIARQVATRYAFQDIPAYYCAPRASSPIVIDGQIDHAEWTAAPWSEPFVDIEGDAKPKPRFETRVRMMWDDTNLYIAARIEEPHVWGTLKNHDDIVFNDNDFEVFVDPEGDARWYGEVEVNALGTIFDLRLAKPYTEGGPAHHDWSPPGIRAAVAIDGTLNDPSDVDRGWTVEIAIPYSALADHAAVPMPPRAGDVWRINFSRVQWQHDVVDGRYLRRPGTKEDNWVWTPQHVVDMHRPREWGFVEFAGSRP